MEEKTCNVLGENKNEGTENNHGEEQRGNTYNNKEDVLKLQSESSVVTRRGMGVRGEKNTGVSVLGQSKGKHADTQLSQFKKCLSLLCSEVWSQIPPSGKNMKKQKFTEAFSRCDYIFGFSKIIMVVEGKQCYLS